MLKTWMLRSFDRDFEVWYRINLYFFHVSKIEGEKT